MRIWSVHPSLVDARGLVACWRETLLAQKVLRGLTKGYTNHPQLDRFKATDDPLAYICTYLHRIADEADARGYHFDRSRIVAPSRELAPLPVTEGQLQYEFDFLCAKVSARDEAWWEQKLRGASPAAHPLFTVVPGDIEPWEKIK
ncbi:pyrimidine dimer DNA glycosylase/endonuclease V [Rothia sp. LK2588]|uniref:pyrimidine dimer DNA glycosylase/endonuclease V n=1 Tax=Rothia sp. LK2588 TaxID=3114369 RepID=UPI0034CF7CBD